MRRVAARILAGGRTATAAVLATVLMLASPVALPTGRGAAQVVRERPVPLDTAGTVQEIDPELRRALDLFPEVEGFRAARLFELADGRFVLEISFRDADGPGRERRPLSAVEATELRGRVSAGLALGARGAYATEGRAGLVLTSTALGLGYYGWAVPAVLDLEPRGAVAAYLLTAGASFLLPYRLTANRPVTRTRRNAASWGATRGIVYGLLLGDALTGGEENDDRVGSPDEGDEDAILATGMATSLLGGVLGYTYGGRPGLDEGSVAFRATLGDFGLAWGFGTSVALGLYDGEVRCSGDVCGAGQFERRPGGQLATVALGAAATAAAGRWPGSRSYTLGDARALRSFGLLGAQTVLPLAWAALEDRHDGERGVAAGLVAGSLAGMWMGDRLLRDRQLSSGGGLLVLAGHLAGGLGALGLTYLVDDDGSDREVLYMTTSALGSLAGSWFTLRAVGDASGSGSGGPAVEIHSLPLALMSLVAPPSGGRTDVPWVTVRF